MCPHLGQSQSAPTKQSRFLVPSSANTILTGASRPFDQLHWRCHNELAFIFHRRPTSGQRGVQESEEISLNNVILIFCSSFSLCLQVIPTCVYLMSRIAVHMEIEGTAQCPAQVMLAAALGCEELGIANKLLAQSIFGLWMTSSLLGTLDKYYTVVVVVAIDISI